MPDERPLLPVAHRPMAEEEPTTAEPVREESPPPVDPGPSWWERNAPGPKAGAAATTGNLLIVLGWIFDVGGVDIPDPVLVAMVALLTTLAVYAVPHR